MQLHVNVLRNMNQPMYEAIGADKGFDSVGAQSGIAKEILYLLNDGSISDIIPKMICIQRIPMIGWNWLQGCSLSKAVVYNGCSSDVPGGSMIRGKVCSSS